MEFEEAFAQLVHKLNTHEQKSQARYEHLCEKLDGHQPTGVHEMSQDGMGGLGAAAVISALGNRNESGDSIGPILAATMGNRGHTDGFLGGGGGILAGLLLGSLIGGRGRGLFGGGEDCGTGGITPGQAAFDQTILSGITGLTAAVPTTGLQTQNAIQASIGQLALADQQGFSGVKDAVQNLALFQSNQLNNINQNVSSQGCQTREVVQAGTTAVLTAIKDNTIAELQARLASIESHGRSRETEFNITQTVNQNQLQAQQQQQQQQGLELMIARLLGGFNQTMLARQAQDIVNLGTMTASGTQAAANTQVR